MIAQLLLPSTCAVLTFATDVDEHLRRLLHGKFKNLASAFINSAIVQMNAVIEPCRPALQTGGIPEAVNWQYVWEHFSSFIQFAGRISNFLDGADVGFELFCEAFNRMLLFVWFSKDVDDDYIYLVLDEALLKLCKKKALEIDGSKGLQLWRKRLLSEMMEYSGEEYDRASFLLRALQYISTITTAGTLRIVVPKVVEGRLPNELSDMVYHWALRSHGIAPDDHQEKNWQPGPGRTFVRDCCSLASRHDELGSEIASFWSTIDCKYIRFHQINVEQLISLDMRFYDGEGDEIWEDARVHIRCGEEVPTVHKAWELEELRPTNESRNDLYFKAGEPVNRKWRIYEA